MIVDPHAHVGELPLSGVEIRKVEASGLDEPARRRVLGLNTRRLFFGGDDVAVSAPQGGADG